MNRAAAPAFALTCLLVSFLWLGRKRASVRPHAALPMPDAPRRRPAQAGRAPAPGFGADGAARASAGMPRTPDYEATAAHRTPEAGVGIAEDKGELLDEVLRSHNDNDPRLDGAFNGLPVETRRLFRRKYRELPPENRNQRGTIVYLLGKNLAAPEDWAFLREVAGEPPCLSLADCTKADSGHDAGEDPSAAVTLAYPALVALKQAERVLAEGGPSSARREALAVVRAGKDSRIPAVADAAARLEKRSL